MCLISLKSYKFQFFKILDSLYSSYVRGAISKFPVPGMRTFEQCVNKVVFGIPSPPRKKMEYLAEHLKVMREWKQKPVLELNLYPNNTEKVWFINENPFDLPNSNFENIWVLINTLSAEHVLQLFKRILFSTCNILVCDDPRTLNMSIQGIIDLFYPLTIDMVCIPNLPESMLEYVNMCG